jgi:hypothetical protein
VKEDAMDTPIGEAAGRIWPYLVAYGEAMLPQLQRGTTLPARPLLRRVGWLAREGKLCLVKECEGLKLSLQEP